MLHNIQKPYRKTGGIIDFVHVLMAVCSSGVTAISLHTLPMGIKSKVLVSFPNGV